MTPVHVQWLTGNRMTDYAFALVFALLFYVGRALLVKLVYEPTGRAVLSARGKLEVKTEGEPYLKRWNESCWKFTVYSTFASLGFLASFQEPWFWDTKFYWLGCTRLPCLELYVSPWVLLFYCAETGFYLQAIPFLLYKETRRKDWRESMAHHVVTLLLLSYSYYLNFTRVGIMVLFVHDIADIFLETAKLARYCGQQGIAIVAFTAFFIVWMLTRVVYFPLVIIRSTLFEPIELVAKVYDIPTSPHWEIFNGALIIIFVLNVYWSWLILMVLYKQLVVGDAGDIREKDD